MGIRKWWKSVIETVALQELAAKMVKEDREREEKVMAAKTKALREMLSGLADAGITADDLLAALTAGKGIPSQKQGGTVEGGFEPYTVVDIPTDTDEKVTAEVNPSTKKAGNADVKFSGKPSEAVRLTLRKCGFLYSGYLRTWYGPAAALPDFLSEEKPQPKAKASKPKATKVKAAAATKKARKKSK